jgi:hypothetical protein
MVFRATETGALYAIAFPKKLAFTPKMRGPDLRTVDVRSTLNGRGEESTKYEVQSDQGVDASLMSRA